VRGIWNFYQDAVVSSFHPQKERCPHALGVFINYVQGRHGRFLAIGRHSGSHFTSPPPLPLPFSISQNPAKDQAFAALPPVAALMYHFRSIFIPLLIQFLQEDILIEE
jgi:hypothetical protein